MSRIRLLAVLGLLAGLSACASVRPLAVPEGQGASLVIYQPTSSYTEASSPFVYVDDQNQGRLGLEGVIRLSLPAGQHRIATREPLLFWPGQESAVTELTVGAGETRYVRFFRRQVGVSFDGTNNPHAEVRSSLSEVDAAQGQARQ